jgi:hypothetical protein
LEKRNKTCSGEQMKKNNYAYLGVCLLFTILMSSSVVSMGCCVPASTYYCEDTLIVPDTPEHRYELEAECYTIYGQGTQFFPTTPCSAVAECELGCCDKLLVPIVKKNCGGTFKSFGECPDGEYSTNGICSCDPLPTSTTSSSSTTSTIPTCCCNTGMVVSNGGSCKSVCVGHGGMCATCCCKGDGNYIAVIADPGQECFSACMDLGGQCCRYFVCPPGKTRNLITCACESSGPEFSNLGIIIVIVLAAVVIGILLLKKKK